MRLLCVLARSPARVSDELLCFAMCVESEGRYVQVRAKLEGGHEMIALFTDFGAGDIYTGQMKVAVLHAAAGTTLIDVLHDAPNHNACAAAHLLAALCNWYPPATVFLCVVDPGVGSERDAVVVQADGQWFVGPDNGLLSVVAARAASTRTWRITWRPERLSASFHGRDVFAPVAGWISRGELDADKLSETSGLQVQLGAGDLAEVIYVDHYGNALTGLRAGKLSKHARFCVANSEVAYARVYPEVPTGHAFWYENSLGLVEIAVNGGSAAMQLEVCIGAPIREALGRDSARE
jgi:S-adenosylmethionine hydrolase